MRRCFISRGFILCAHLCVAVACLWWRSSQTVCNQGRNSAFYNQSFPCSPLNPPITHAPNRKAPAHYCHLTKPDLEKNPFADKWSPLRTCVFWCLRQRRSKPERLCSTPVPAMPAGAEKNDIIFLWWMQTLSDWPRIGEAGIRQVDKEQQREAETGGPDGDGWFMDGDKKREEISVQERRESIKAWKQAAGLTSPSSKTEIIRKKGSKRSEI